MPSWLVSLPDRLDVFLSTDGRMRSRNAAQDAITQGLVSVNDVVVTKPSERLQEGDQVEADLPEQTLSELLPADLHLEILYEDAACFVINKPAGIAVHPGAGMPPGEVTLLSGLAFLFDKWKLPFFSNGALVHRLDKDTTGALLCGKTLEAHIALQKQFQDRSVTKEYLALTAGIPDPQEAVIDAPIGRHATARTTMSVTQVSAARDAKTGYKVLATTKNIALVLCHLFTGRTHQVRVHLSAIGYPILGDGTYGTDASNRLTQENGIEGLMLHAWKLSFESPTGKKVEVTAGVPQLWKDALKKLNIKEPK
jgi:23S rRNA pseudouridine1911/1915/1917 synthase